MEDQNFGVAIIERSLLRTLECLWEGPLRPAYLPLIERAIRAILTSRTLTASRFGAKWHGGEETHPSLPIVEYEEPFDDQLLDYEFTYPREPHPFKDLGESESKFLSDLVLTRLNSAVSAVLPHWIQTEGQALTYLDEWYDGHPADECEAKARMVHSECDEDNIVGPRFKDYTKSFRKDRFLAGYEIYFLFSDLAMHAKYLVGCHRAGLIVY
jgi:hypothetical protein